jgi:hypothetical protein
MGITKFKNQSYGNLKKRCQSEGKLFVDPEFPPEVKSMYHSRSMPPDQVEWKRPKVWLDFYLAYLLFHASVFKPHDDVFISLA